MTCLKLVHMMFSFCVYRDVYDFDVTFRGVCTRKGEVLTSNNKTHYNKLNVLRRNP